MKDIEEFKKIAAENGYPLTDEEAEFYFGKIDVEKFLSSGELTDDELNNVSGGGCGITRNGRHYSSEPPHKLIVTWGNHCKFFKDQEALKVGLKNTCFKCYHAGYGNSSHTLYCNFRTFDNDPLNPMKK